MAGSLLLVKGAKTNNANELDLTDGTCPFQSVDTSDSNPGVYPIPIPASGTSYSAECWVHAEVNAAPDNSIVNLRFWGPGGNRQETNTVLWVGTSVSSATPTDGGTTITAWSSNLINSARAYPTPASNLVWDNYSTLVSGGDKSGWLVMQLHVGPGAPVGTLSNENCVMHYSYDES